MPRKKAAPEAEAPEVEKTPAKRGVKKDANAEVKKTPVKRSVKKDTKAEAGKKLVIVESPTKAKTLTKILGSRYVVKSSVGHIRDLPKSRLAIDVENGFTPEYILVKGRPGSRTNSWPRPKGPRRCCWHPTPTARGRR